MHEYTVGERVTWTHISQRGRSITLRCWEGRITGFEQNGQVALVKRQGKTYRVRLGGLRRASEAGELTDLVMGRQRLEDTRPAEIGEAPHG